MRILSLGPGLPHERQAAQQLQQLPCEVVAVQTREDALRRLQTGSFDLLLAHKDAPGMDAPAFCEAVRQTPGCETLPLLLFAGSVDFGDLLWALQCGVDAFLPEDCCPALLVAHIRQAVAQDSCADAPVPLLVGQTLLQTPLSSRRACNLLLSCVCHEAGALVAQPQHAPPVRKPAAAGPLRLLLAEDNQINKLYLTRVLTSQGHDVMAVENGRAALEALEAAFAAAHEAGAFDLALLDIQMPVMDGLEVLRRIRQGRTAAPRDLPAIAITAHGLEGDREALLREGFDDYLSKPVEPADIAAVLVRLGAASRGQTASQPAPDAGEQETLAVCDQDSYTLDRGKTLARLKDAGFVDSLYTAFLGDLDRRTASLKAALASGDMASLHKQAHSLKGALSVLDATRSRELAFALECCAKEEAADCGQRLDDLLQALDALRQALEASLQRTGQ